MEATENVQGLEQQSGQNSEQESQRALQATQDSLDQVRDILVGSQLRQQDQRFGQLEDKLAGQIAAFEEQHRQRFAALEGLVKGELAAVGARLATETGQLAESLRRGLEESRNADRGIVEKLEQATRAISDEARNAWGKAGDDLRAASTALEARAAATEQTQAAALSELRTQLFDQTKKAGEQAHEHRTELLALIEKMGSELRAAKPDRATLANLFTEMAGRLQN